MTKKRYDFLKSAGIETEDKFFIEKAVNNLIAALYKPHEELEFVRDAERCLEYGVDEEPINWGDLKCNTVEKFFGGNYLITIDEASPNSCPTLCEYIERFMRKWGWDVRVVTEW